MVEQRRHAQHFTRGVVYQEAVVASMAIDVRHNRVHHNHLAEAFLGAMLRRELKHVRYAERSAEKPMRGNKALFFRGEDRAFAGKLPVELHKAIGHVIDLGSLEQIGSKRLRIRLESSIGVAGGTALKKLYLLPFANPTLGERARGGELRRGRRILATVHARAVEGNARNDIIEGITIQGYIFPGKRFIHAFHPKRVGKRKAAHHADEVMTSSETELPHQLIDGIAMLGYLPSVDPIVDVDEAIGKIRVGLLNQIIEIIVELGSLFISGNHHVLVHELIQHGAPPSERTSISHYKALRSSAPIW